MAQPTVNPVSTRGISQSSPSTIVTTTTTIPVGGINSNNPNPNSQGGIFVQTYKMVNPLDVSEINDYETANLIMRVDTAISTLDYAMPMLTKRLFSSPFCYTIQYEWESDKYGYSMETLLSKVKAPFPAVMDIAFYKQGMKVSIANLQRPFIPGTTTAAISSGDQMLTDIDKPLQPTRKRPRVELVVTEEDEKEDR